jgi:hypothetical protein
MIHDTSTVSLPLPTGGTIVEIELYALGAGGGGQGGNLNEGLIFTERGTGGAGGGGSAAYLKLGNLGLSKNGTVSLSVTVGSGGAGGSATTTSSTNAGCSGGRGGATTVAWSAKSITLNAPGGSGGGSGSTTCTGNNVNGGAGGTRGSVNPSNSNLYVSSPFFADGSTGSTGNIDHGTTTIASNGGKAATISNRGTLSSFGGGSGGSLAAGSFDPNPAQNGGGGIGAPWTNDGRSGGNGLVTIVFKYFTEE